MSLLVLSVPVPSARPPVRPVRLSVCLSVSQPDWQSEKGIIICQLAIVCYPLVTNTYEGGSSSTRFFRVADTRILLRNAITYGISSMIFDRSPHIFSELNSNLLL